MARYSILTHDSPFPHWDLLLDPGNEELLWTWRIPVSPENSGRTPVERQPDHRRIYLDYSGPISGNRGHVTLWDKGEYEILSEGQLDVATSSLTLRCRGGKLDGEVLLHLREGTEWTFEYLPVERVE